MKQFTSFIFVWYKLQQSCNSITACFCLLLFLPLCLFSQAPTIQWDKTIGGSSDDYLFSLRQTSEGGYILGGYSNSPISGDKSENSKGANDYWVVKLDANGTKQWDKTIGGNDRDDLQSIQQTSDGGYILGGYSFSGVSGDKTEGSKGFLDYWVVKLDANGTKQWDKTIGGWRTDHLSDLQQTSDGGYILGGFSDSPVSGDKTDHSSEGLMDYWVVKLNADGTKQWDKTIGGNNTDVLSRLQQTSDGGYILGGYSHSNISGDKTENSNGNHDFWVVKLDANGTKQWDKTIGGDSYDALKAMRKTIDGGYILGGKSLSSVSGDKTENSKGDFDYWMVKLDANGTKLWDKTVGGNSGDQLYDLQQTSDGGCLLGGPSFSPASGDKTEDSKGHTDYWVVKLFAAPTFSLICPSSLSINNDPGKCYAVVNGIDPDVSTNTNNNVADPNEVVIANPNIIPDPNYENVNYKIEKGGLLIEQGKGSVSGKQFTTGINTVTYSLVDNPSQSCSFTVEVKDEEEPVIANYPAQINLCFNSSNNYIIPPINPSDNCGLAYVEYKIYSIPYVIDENGVLLPNRTGSGNDASGSFYVTESRRDFLISWYVEDVNGNSTSFATNVHINYELTAAISDVFAVNPGGASNTIYLGYGPASISLAAEITGGNAPYSYQWELGTTQLGTEQSLIVGPNVAGTYNYKLTVTDASGCTAEITKTVKVVDIWSDKKKTKVYICHRDSRGTWTQLSILTGSVANHLVHGDYLGICNNNSSNSEILTRAANETGGQEIIQKGFKIFPNPATHFLDVQWTTKNTSHSYIRILNVEGKTVKTITTQGVVNQQRISLNGLAKGVYMLVLKTGADQQVSKFVIQ